MVDEVRYRSTELCLGEKTTVDEWVSATPDDDEEPLPCSVFFVFFCGEGRARVSFVRAVCFVFHHPRGRFFVFPDPDPGGKVDVPRVNDVSLFRRSRCYSGVLRNAVVHGLVVVIYLQDLSQEAVSTLRHPQAAVPLEATT